MNFVVFLKKSAFSEKFDAKRMDSVPHFHSKNVFFNICLYKNSKVIAVIS